jgi:hypothetical protein
MAQYNYILSDFPNNKYNSDTLSEEIIVSSISSTLERIDGNLSGCSIFFLTDLSGPDLTTLNTVVSNHQGDPAADAGNVEITGSLFINAKDVSISTTPVTISAIDASGQIVNASISPIYYGQDLQIEASLGIMSTTAQTPQIAVSMTTSDLPSGSYKVTVTWLGSYTHDKSWAIYDVTINDTPQGVRPQIQFAGPKDVDPTEPFYRQFYVTLSGVNIIQLRYWWDGLSPGGINTISDAIIELKRL